MRVAFFGSPIFAVPALRELASRCRVELVLTQPARPSGRGRKPTPTAVHSVARDLGLAVRVYEPARRAEIDAALNGLELDVLVVVAFGHILKPSTLANATHGAVNVHASLLPRWRGVAPIERALWAGDAVTGVTLMALDPGVDTGDILAQRIVPIAPEDTRVSLGDKLSRAGAELLSARLAAWVRGEIRARAQLESAATYAPRLHKDEGRIDWRHDPVAIWRQVRAVYGWPGAFTDIEGEVLKVHEVQPGDLLQTSAPGTIVRADARGGVQVACGGGTLVLGHVQLAGKSPVPAASLVGSRKLRAGMRLGAGAARAQARPADSASNGGA